MPPAEFGTPTSPPNGAPHQDTGFRDSYPVEYRISRAKLHHYGRFPNGDHYYTYVTRGRSCGGARLNGFLVGALVGLCTAAWWQRRQCQGGNGKCEMERNKNAVMPEDINQ